MMGRARPHQSSLKTSCDRSTISPAVGRCVPWLARSRSSRAGAIAVTEALDAAFEGAVAADGGGADGDAAGINAGRLVAAGWSPPAALAAEVEGAPGAGAALPWASARVEVSSGAQSATGNSTFERWRRRMIGARCITSWFERKADRAEGCGKLRGGVATVVFTERIGDAGAGRCASGELFEKRFDVATHRQELLSRMARVDRSIFVCPGVIGLVPRCTQFFFGARDRESLLVQ